MNDEQKTVAIDLSTEICGIKLKNPLVLASGTAGYAMELARFMDMKIFGAITLKGVSLLPRKGNPPPRLAETPFGMINAIGLQNNGVDNLIETILPLMKNLEIPLFANIFGEKEEEYAQVAEKLDQSKMVEALEINISCPNVEKGGISFGSNPNLAARVVSKVREKTSLPLIVKLSPNTDRITQIAKAVIDSGADALSLVNTFSAMAINIKTRKSRLTRHTGGLSGPAIKPLALAKVWEITSNFQVPVIGMGGIMTGEDVLEFMLLGAQAVGLGTVVLTNPKAPAKIIEELKALLLSFKIKTLKDWIGSYQGVST